MPNMEKIIVVDDDPMVGDLTLSILEEAGYQAELISDSRLVMQAVKERRPDLLILDVLMPGIDGLTLCHGIKSDPQLSSIKVAIVSGKSFEAEKERAQRCGADIFIEKPYKVETFAQRIKDLLGSRGTQPAAAPDIPALPASPRQGVGILKIWGCRGPSPSNAPPSRYGRRTPCVSLELADRLLIFDAGSGLDPLAQDIIAGRHRALWLFMTQFHEDHAEGLGRFACARRPGFTLSISGANDLERSLPSMVEKAFEDSAETAPVAADIQLYELLEETYEIFPGARLTSFYANHPGTTLGYKLETGGRALVYCPDSELYGEVATAFQDYDEKLGRICAGADLLIHDGRYFDSDYASRKNRGHSSAANAVDFAARFEVKELILFHQDGSYDDKDLDRMAAEVQKQIAAKGHALKCALAREGLTIAL